MCRYLRQGSDLSNFISARFMYRMQYTCITCFTKTILEFLAVFLLKYLKWTVLFFWIVSTHPRADIRCHYSWKLYSHHLYLGVMTLTFDPTLIYKITNNKKVYFSVLTLSSLKCSKVHLTQRHHKTDVFLKNYPLQHQSWKTLFSA